MSGRETYITEPLIELLAIQLYLVSPVCLGAGRYAYTCSPERQPWTHISRERRDYFRAVARGTEPLVTAASAKAAKDSE